MNLTEQKSLADGVAEHTVSTNELMKGNMQMIDEINRQRESNKVLKLRVQSDTGELRRVYQVIAAKGERAKGLGLTRLFDDPPDLTDTQQQQQHIPGEDLTVVLYRNRQRLLALRSAVAELEARKKSAPVSAPLALPPIDAMSGVVVDDRRPSTVFMTATVPPISSIQVMPLGSVSGSERAEEEEEGMRNRGRAGQPSSPSLLPLPPQSLLAINDSLKDSNKVDIDISDAVGVGSDGMDEPDGVR